MPPKRGQKMSNTSPASCRHGGPRATSHILECINIMVNHNEFGVTEEEFQEHGNDEGRVQELLLTKMERFISKHPEAAGDDSIKTLTALAVEEMLLNNLENARLMYQSVPFLKFFAEHGVEGIKSRSADLERATESVNAVADEQGMLATLRKEVGTACKCLTLEDWERPSKQEEEPEGLTYAECLAAPFVKIPAKKYNALNQDSRLHVEIRSRLCPPNDKRPYICIIIAPSSRYIFHSFPVEETKADEAFMHVLEGIVMAVVTEGMGMVDEAVRIRPTQLTTTDPLLAKFLSPLLQGTRVSVAASSNKVVNADPEAKTKESPLIAIMDGIFADFNKDIKKPNSRRKLPIGDTMAEEAKWKLKSKTSSGKEKYTVDKEAEEREIPDRVIACKGCNELKIRSEVKQCSLCSEVWYCGNECQASDWSAGHKTECSRKNEGKKRSKGGGHVSEDSGEDLAGQAEKDALRSFAVDLSAVMPPVGGGGGKKRGGGKKKGKGKKK
ncbi:unnamed protein product [Ascophyllum nodosum]